MTKRIETMTDDEIEQYMGLLGRATDAIMPEGAVFVVIVFSGNGKAHVASTAPRPQMFQAVRTAINEMEKREHRNDQE